MTSSDRGVRDSQNVRDSKGSLGLKNTSAIEPSEMGQLTELQASLKELLDVQKDTEYLDLSEQSIESIADELMPYIA